MMTKVRNLRLVLQIKFYFVDLNKANKARFKRRISVASNAIQIIDNETAYLIIYCLNCIRRDGNSTYETGVKHVTFKEIILS